MEPTIIQNGALYALQHGAITKYRRVPQKRMRSDRIWALPTLKTSTEKFTLRPTPPEKAQSAPQNTSAQLVDAFPEYRAAA
jgi:hypothetical protein